MNHHYQGKPEKIRRLGEAVSKVIRGIDNRIREYPGEAIHRLQSEGAESLHHDANPQEGQSLPDVFAPQRCQKSPPRFVDRFDGNSISGKN